MSAEYAPRTYLATRVANIQIFPPILVGLFPLLLVNFSILSSEASGGFKIFNIKNFGMFFCNKHLCLYSALAGLDFNYSNQEK